MVSGGHERDIRAEPGERNQENPTMPDEGVLSSERERQLARNAIAQDPELRADVNENYDEQVDTHATTPTGRVETGLDMDPNEGKALKG